MEFHASGDPLQEVVDRVIHQPPLIGCHMGCLLIVGNGLLQLADSYHPFVGHAYGLAQGRRAVAAIGAFQDENQVVDIAALLFPIQ